MSKGQKGCEKKSLTVDFHCTCILSKSWTSGNLWTLCLDMFQSFVNRLRLRGINPLNVMNVTQRVDVDVCRSKK